MIPEVMVMVQHDSPMLLESSSTVLLQFGIIIETSSLLITHHWQEARGKRPEARAVCDLLTAPPHFFHKETSS